MNNYNKESDDKSNNNLSNKTNNFLGSLFPTPEKSDFFGIFEDNSKSDMFEFSSPKNLEKRRSKKFYYNDEKLLFPFEITPRVHHCIDNIKMGVKMGAAIGSIFGGINGTYHAIKYKNYMSIPISAIGGAISFGFFLGCGMLVRCQSINDSNKKYNRFLNELKYTSILGKPKIFETNIS